MHNFNMHFTQAKSQNDNQAQSNITSSGSRGGIYRGASYYDTNNYLHDDTDS